MINDHCGCVCALNNLTYSVGVCGNSLQIFIFECIALSITKGQPVSVLEICKLAAEQCVVSSINADNLLLQT